MTFCYTTKGRSVNDAAQKMASKLDERVETDRIYSRAHGATMNAIGSLLALAAEPVDGHDLILSVACSCGAQSRQPFDRISLSINIGTVPRTS